ncbi:hypothetical protein GCM10009773_00140 [Williamsia serinedens]
MSAAACSVIGPDLDTEEYRTPAAPVVATASCAWPGIVQELGYGFSTSQYTDTPREGSIPEDFVPTKVVRCEVRDTGDATSIDEVTLSGDVGAVRDAFALPSLRYRDGDPSCAVRADAPVAVWLVADDGAIRVGWPAAPCDLRSEPLDPLAELRETSRRSVASVPRQPVVGDPAAECRGAGSVRLGDLGAERRPAVRLPEQAVATTTLCASRVVDLPNNDWRTEQLGSTRLSAQDSTRLVREILASPPASRDCTTRGTEVITATLRRPDGSGGGLLTAERNGCRRIAVDNLITYRSTTPAVDEILRRRD